MLRPAALMLSVMLTSACSADGSREDDPSDVGASGPSSGAGGNTGQGAGGTTGDGGAGGAATSTSSVGGGATTGSTTSAGGGGGAPPTSVCGDGVLQAGENCDDGVISANCDTWHDGGDGTCVAPGTCVMGFILSGGACLPEVATASVNIFVDNFCAMTVTPTSFTVAPGQRLKLSYHNTSADYAVDVWKSYGGGYLDLPTGATWNETYEHCSGPNAYTEWADISTACSMYKLTINCL